MKRPALRWIEGEDGEEVRRLGDGAEAGIDGELCRVARTDCVNRPLPVSAEDVRWSWRFLRGGILRRRRSFWASFLKRRCHGCTGRSVTRYSYVEEVRN